jgi:hypothetical protein
LVGLGTPTDASQASKTGLFSAWLEGYESDSVRLLVSLSPREIFSTSRISFG